MSKKYLEEGGGDVCLEKRNENGKKNIFLIGDSIREGYCNFTENALSDIANVKYPNENCRNTQFTYISLAWWKNIFENPESVDVFYWNNGHWDIAHWGGDEESLNSVEQYSEMTVRIYKKAKKIFPKAKIVFSTTLPANPDGSVGVNPRTTNEIIKYNEAAKNVLKKYDVLIDDVFELFKDKGSEYYSDYCHLTREGYEILGNHVADYIRKII